MGNLKKLQKWVETINTYHAFGLIVYGVILLFIGNTALFWWFFGISTPLLAGWTGYLLKAFFEQHNQRHGFKTRADSVSYEINENNKYLLRFKTKIEARRNNLMVYPLGYQWTGKGEEGIPKISGKGQQLLSLIERKGKAIKIIPYKSTNLAANGEWNYSFIALNPPLHKGDTVNIEYSQEFYDSKGVARPYLYYFVRIPIDRLELHVKFNKKSLPQRVTGSIVKTSDPDHPYPKIGVEYDRDKQWASWVINKPKRGYYYRIHWE